MKNENMRYKKFSCCGKMFVKWISLYEHLGENHEAKPLYVCEFCPEEFSTGYLLRCHAFQVHNQKYNSTACGSGKRENPVHQKKQQHEDPVEVDESLRCQTCGKVWKTKSSLHIHMAHLHGVRFEKHPKVPCPEPNCVRTFNGKANAEAHFARDHRKQFLFHCDLCGKGFYRKKALASHQQSEHGNTSLICELCGKGFKNRDLLYCHRWNAHKKDKNQKKTPEVCDICGKAFTSRQGFQAHQATVHNINVKFSCHVCAQPFPNRSQMKTHLYSKHSMGEPPNTPDANAKVKFNCYVCSKIFPAQAKLDRHLYSKHKIGERPAGMKKYTEIFKFQCQLHGCKLRFTKQEILDQHVKEAHGDSGTEMPFKCRFCKKGFSVKYKHEQHEMIHTNKETRPFKCDICGKGFTNSHNLRYHELYTHKAERKYKYPNKKQVSGAK